MNLGTRSIGSGAGAGAGCTSTAPMSQFGLVADGRGRPRSSVVIPIAPSFWHDAAATPSIKGLPACGKSVGPGPPLSARGPSTGSSVSPWRSVALSRSQVVVYAKLYPCDVVDTAASHVIPGANTLPKVVSDVSGIVGCPSELNPASDAYVR